MVHWYFMTIMVIWVTAAIGSKFTKDANPFYAAIATTLILGWFCALSGW